MCWFRRVEKVKESPPPHETVRFTPRHPHRPALHTAFTQVHTELYANTHAKLKLGEKKKDYFITLQSFLPGILHIIVLLLLPRRASFAYITGEAKVYVN